MSHVLAALVGALLSALLVAWILRPKSRTAGQIADQTEEWARVKAARNRLIDEEQDRLRKEKARGLVESIPTVVARIRGKPGDGK